MNFMKEVLSPGSLVTLAGGVLTVIGVIAYTTGNANLSLPTIFYGIPILLGGLALKSSELPPAVRVIPKGKFKKQREQAPKDLVKLLEDVTRWRYGQKAHLESSLESLKLWDDDNPPQLTEIEELYQDKKYGLRLRFKLGAITFEKWTSKRERLERFFAKGMKVQLNSEPNEELDLVLLPLEQNNV